MDLFSDWGIELPDDLVEAVGGGVYLRPQVGDGPLSVP